MMSNVRIGISGWRYAPWRGVFYPPRWPQARELAYAAGKFSSVELNGSFYSLQRASSYRRWAEATPPGFVFALKGGRFITHMKRLRNVEVPLANFFASGLLALGPKMGPFLWQLPPSQRFDPSQLAAFFDLLPRTIAEAAHLAGGHDDKVAEPLIESAEGGSLRLRHALEIRHPSFESPAFIDLLRSHDIGLVVADTAGHWPLLEDVTSDFVYVRLHGDEELYASGYSAAALDEWARKIRAWMRGATPRGARLAGPRPARRGLGCDVYVYFDNDAKVHAPFDAMALAHRLGLGPEPDTPFQPAAPEEVRRSWPPISPRWRTRKSEG